MVVKLGILMRLQTMGAGAVSDLISLVPDVSLSYMQLSLSMCWHLEPTARKSSGADIENDNTVSNAKSALFLDSCHHPQRYRFSKRL